MSGPIHPTAIVATERLGGGCTVREYASLGADVTVGDNVHVGAGARIDGHVRIGDGVSVGPNAVLGRIDGAEGEIHVGRGATLGANVSIAPGVAIGRGVVVEAGSVVETDVPAYAVVRGSPARIVDYVDTLPDTTEPEILDLSTLEKPTSTGVSGVMLHPLTHARDLRGSLAATEFADLPFPPQRVFAVYDVPNESIRGAHAHRACSQMLVCMAGEVSCVADDGTARQEFRLTSPRVGLFIPPLIWSMQYRYTGDASLLVLAELPYDPDDYVRDYEEFLELVASRQPQGSD